VSGTAYTAPDQLRITYRRPIYDFTQSSDTPDFPMQWPRLILFRLADDLGDLYGIPMEERNRMIQKAKASFTDIFAGGGAGAKVKSGKPHNKVRYF
jgi:hypothetical protein